MDVPSYGASNASGQIVVQQGIFSSLRRNTSATQPDDVESMIDACVGLLLKFPKKVWYCLRWAKEEAYRFVCTEIDNM